MQVRDNKLVVALGDKTKNLVLSVLSQAFSCRPVNISTLGMLQGHAVSPCHLPQNPNSQARQIRLKT